MARWSKWMWSAVLVAAAAMAGCSTQSKPTAAESRAAALISDAQHDGGTAGFVFMPPVVPTMPVLGGFVPDARPTVRVDELDSTGRTLRTMATFNSLSGPGNERVRVHLAGAPDIDGDPDQNEYYVARWKTKDLSLTATYRIRVLVAAAKGGFRELGFADLDVVQTQAELAQVDTQHYTGLVDGALLRIKFRIDRPAVDADLDGIYDWVDNCPTTANSDQQDTVGNGVGDACRCAQVVCTALDSCHEVGICQPTTGTCTHPQRADGSSCPLPNAQAACADGACGIQSCVQGFDDCDRSTPNGCETDLRTTTHCGSCSVACSPGANATEICTAGRCGLSCAAGWADCDGNLATGCEQDVSSSLTHCGACGNVCTLGRTCQAGACTTAACQPGFADCNGNASDGCEVTPASDVSHCGSCGNACALAHATATCTAGACTVASCAAGYGDCDGVAANGCERDLLASVASCGACGNACQLAHAVPACVTGQCRVASCVPGWADCNASPADGCEVHVAADPTSCGACGAACVVPNANASCVTGACGIGSCKEGFADCDGVTPNGCEADLSSTATCGGCGVACEQRPHAVAACSAGACDWSCEAGWGDCDADAANGCETDLSTSQNCGACGGVCTQARTCQAGACSTAVCAPGFADCNGLPGDGCEVNLKTDTGNCGACGSRCTPFNAVAECTEGVCGFSTCFSGKGNCDGNPVNGCETSFSSDGRNCGGCGNDCGRDRFCTNGTCGGVCGTSSADCDGNAFTLCEASLWSDFSCGACGVTCGTRDGMHASSGCVGPGVGCSLICHVGWANCDGDRSNGCETPLRTLDNCGGCGDRCNPTNTVTNECVERKGALFSTWECKSICQPGTLHCNGPSGGCTPQIITYLDSDGDGYGGSAAPQCPNVTLSKWISTGGDCNDNDPNVHPGQTAWFTSPSNNGSWDYDCNGVAQGIWGGTVNASGVPTTQPTQGLCYLFQNVGCVFNEGWANPQTMSCSTSSPYVNGCFRSGFSCNASFSAGSTWGCH